MQLSELIGKQVINIFDAKIEGIVTNVLFECKNMIAKYLIVVDEETYEKKVLAREHVYRISGAVTIKNHSALQLIDNLELELMGYHNPINSSVFTTDGDYFDTVVDLELTNKLKIKHFNLKTHDLNTENIACFNSTVVLLYNLNEVHSLAKYRVKQPINQRIVSANTVTTLNETPDSVQLSLPKKAITNYFFLLNRMVTKDILNPNGDLIVKQNTIITPNIVDKVRCYGKLNELTKYSSL